MEHSFIKGEFSSRVDIRIFESRCPQEEIRRKIWYLSPGTKVRIYVGKVKPTLPLPTQPYLLFPEIFDYELDLEINAEDNQTQIEWEHFRDLSLTRGRK